MTDRIESGDFVILEEAPDGYISQYYNVTVGQIYQVRGLMGSCLVIDEDDGVSTATVSGRDGFKGSKVQECLLGLLWLD